MQSSETTTSDSAKAGIASRLLRADVILAFAVIGILATLVLRVPPSLLDALLALNLGVSALVLLVALYTSEPLRFASFPTVILLTTLFRLALNVTSTKLILLDAHAGQLIEAFGRSVVGGNLVVGGVVFAIITVIQFLVVAKGSERVSEVSARFMLDAMPGKQMAIDYDLQSGVISNEEGARRREALATESKLYGAMEGAMKFVKGDAIAGIVIALVNILGGLLIGVLMSGMTVLEAAETYSILTIGDGLVSQIPSIVTSLAAGLVVTRVASARDTSVAKDLASQFLAYPRALWILCALLLAFAVVPGFPTLSFAVLGATAGLLARHAGKLEAARAQETRAAAERKSAEDAEKQAKRERAGRTAYADLELRLGSAWAEAWQSREFQAAIAQEAGAFRDSRGLPEDAPGLRVRAERDLDRWGYEIRVQGALVAAAKLPETEVVFIAGDPGDELASLVEAFVEVPFDHARCAVLRLTEELRALPAYRELEAAEFTFDRRDYLRRDLRAVLEAHAHAFVDARFTRSLVARLEEKGDMPRPDLLEALRDERPTLPLTLLDLFQQLLQDGFSLRDRIRILECVARERDPSRRAASVREALLPQAIARFRTIDPVTKETMIETLVLGDALSETLDGLDPSRPLPASLRARLDASLRDTLADPALVGRSVMLRVADADVERLRHALRADFPRLFIVGEREFAACGLRRDIQLRIVEVRQRDEAGLPG